jgi:hypothetical protein
MNDILTYQIQLLIKQLIREVLLEDPPDAIKDYVTKSVNEKMISIQNQIVLSESSPLNISIVSTPICINRLWQADDEKFFRLRDKLKKEFDLNWSNDDLSAVFLGIGKFSGDLFRWDRGNKNFAYLMGELGDVGSQDEKQRKTIYIKTQHNDYWSYLCKYFRPNNNYKPEFKPRVLSSQYSQMEGKSQA